MQKTFTQRGGNDIYKDAYDKAFRRGHVKIENAFAQLKNRWRVMKDLTFTVP
jgi:hypothetical protein